MRAPERGLTRLAEKNHSEELHHDVGSKRGAEGNNCSSEWQQHVDEGLRHLVREEKGLEQQPL